MEISCFQRTIACTSRHGGRRDGRSMLTRRRLLHVVIGLLLVFVVFPVAGGLIYLKFNEGRLEIPLRDIYEIAGKARVIEVPALAEGVGETILLGERGTVPKEQRDGPATPAMRFAVSARENHRCAICKRRRALHHHHLESLARGG